MAKDKNPPVRRLTETAWTVWTVASGAGCQTHTDQERNEEEGETWYCAVVAAKATRTGRQRARRRRWVFWLEVPAALLHRPPCADGSGRRAGTPVPTVLGQRRRVGTAASVAGPAKDRFLTAPLDLIVPQHDHAVGRRATDTVRARSALGSYGR